MPPQVLDQDERKTQAVKLLDHADQCSLIHNFANQAGDAAAVRRLLVDQPDATEHIQPVGRKATLGANPIAGGAIKV